MMVAWYLHPRVLPPDFRDIAVAVGILVIPGILIVRQPDLWNRHAGHAQRWIHVVSCRAELAIAGGWGNCSSRCCARLVVVMHEYQKNRVRTFLDPESDPLGDGWNIIQSKIAVGSGGCLAKAG